MCRLWHPLIPFPASTPGKTVQMAQVLVPSTHIGDPGKVSGFNVVQPWMLWPVAELNQRKENSLCFLSLTLSFEIFIIGRF